jgi:hypothetical protein
MSEAGCQEPRARQGGLRRLLVAAAAIAIVLGAGTPPRSPLPVSLVAPAAAGDPPPTTDLPIPDEPNAGLGNDESVVPPPCPLCAEDPGAPVKILSLEAAQAIGAAFSDTNMARLARIDTHLKRGDYGPPESSRARKEAQMLARLLTLNAYSYMIRYGADPDTVWQSDEKTLKPAFDSFSDPGIVPLARLVRARMGRGHMCARYDLSQKARTETVIGGRHLAVRIDDVQIRGETHRALIMDLPTSLHEVVEVWLTEHVSMDVLHVRVAGPPAPYEAYILENMRGLWVHKGGLHRPAAFVFWVSPRDPSALELPKKPLIGARIYVPHLRLRLPSILPDISFEDLRTVDLPQPILELSYLREHKHPAWLEQLQMRGFKDWDDIGPLPPGLRARYPDL